jgi:aminoglycoside/choline kinase family phosphotransferase
MKAGETFQENLRELFKKWSGNEAVFLDLMPGSGSYRRYCRMQSGKISAIGVYNPDQKENAAFLSFTKHFLSLGLPVPAVYAENLSQNIYLLEDLGDDTLFSLISRERQVAGFSPHSLELYKNVIRWLPVFQLKAADGLDYSLCYPRSKFDKQSMLWDLNYFKYYFLKLAHIPFDEQALEDDFEKFANLLSTAPDQYFLYRDFQSRNIMIVNNEPWFIDYQGGRRGAQQYDIASLLWDAKADIPQQLRDELFDYFVEQTSAYVKIDKKKFAKLYYTFVYIRIFQALGAYGFRGYYERKEHFLLSIPYAIKNLSWLMKYAPLDKCFSTLNSVVESLVENENLKSNSLTDDKLVVSVYSFSYKNGIPQDLSGHGGGFVFDCRSLPNPGRFKEYRDFTGLDTQVSGFLDNEPAVHEFYNNSEKLVFQALENYIIRGFNRLMISYGCTGGQHRSVWCAERLKNRLKENFKVEINLVHREL